MQICLCIHLFLLVSVFLCLPWIFAPVLVEICFTLFHCCIFCAFIASFCVANIFLWSLYYSLFIYDWRTVLITCMTDYYYLWFSVENFAIFYGQTGSRNFVTRWGKLSKFHSYRIPQLIIGIIGLSGIKINEANSSVLSFIKPQLFCVKMFRLWQVSKC